jgi:hypothetical protein
MEHNDLKKGMRVRCTGLFGEGPRYAEIMDNQKGIARLCHVEESNGHYPDMGSIYVDEILAVEIDGEWQSVTLNRKHAQRLSGIRAMGF